MYISIKYILPKKKFVTQLCYGKIVINCDTSGTIYVTHYTQDKEIMRRLGK